jgi:putative ABC transport system permease protein
MKISNLFSPRTKTALMMLAYRPATTAGSIAGVISIVFLIGFQMSLFFAVMENISGWLRHSDVDFIVVSKNTVNGLNSAAIPKAYKDRIVGLKEIAWVQPMIQGLSSIQIKGQRTELMQLIGIERPELKGGPWIFAPEQGNLEELLDYKAITVDKLNLSALDNPKIGDLAQFGGKEVFLAGITENIRSIQAPRSYANNELAAQILGRNPSLCNYLLVKAHHWAEYNEDELLKKIQLLLPQATVYTKKGLINSTDYYNMVNTGTGVGVLSAVIASAIVGFIIISLTMFSSVINYTKDFAILRVLGAKKRDILTIIMIQSTFISLIGIMFGSFFLGLALNAMKTTKLGTAYPLWFYPVQIIICLVICYLGAIFGMRKAKSIQPESVFR